MWLTESVKVHLTRGDKDDLHRLAAARGYTVSELVCWLIQDNLRAWREQNELSERIQCARHEAPPHFCCYYCNEEIRGFFSFLIIKEGTLPDLPQEVSVCEKCRKEFPEGKWVKGKDD